MRAIHGGKTKNDKLDAEKIARLLRGGTLPQAYAYPQEKRATRDLLRRRSYLVRMRADLLGHVQLTRHQYNVPAFHINIDRLTEVGRPADPAMPTGIQAINFISEALSYYSSDP
jgi:transposase